MSSLDWSAGARSVKELPANGWYSFRVPVGVGAVSVGLVKHDASTDPAEHIFAFYFSGGRYYIYEGGVNVGPEEGRGFVPETVFSLMRYRGVVYYCVGVDQELHAVPEIPFRIPGTPVAIGSKALESSVYLDASLAMGGDSVVDAAVHDMKDAIVPMTLGPMTLSASQGGGAGAHILIPALKVTALSGVSGANIAFPPAVVAGSQGDESRIDITFLPMTVTAGASKPMLNGASLVMLAPTSWGRTSHLDGADIQMPMAAGGSQGESAGAALNFPAMDVLGFGTARRPGVSIRGRLPALTAPFTAQPIQTVEDVEDVAVASEVVWPSSYMVVTETAVAEDATFYGTISNETVEDSARGVTTILLGVSTDITDGALASDATVPSTYLLLTDTAVAADAAAFSSVTGLEVTDGARASDWTQLAGTADVLDAAVADDHLVSSTDLMVESVALASEETVADSLSDGVMLTDTAVAGDELQVQVFAQALVHDEAIADDELFARNAQAVAWVMNTATGAVSWYDNWAFTAMVEVGGKVFAAGPEGLHVIEGDKDGADPIHAKVQYSFNEFGGYDRDGRPKPNEHKKRVPALWFGYHSDGVLNATVETYGQGYGPFTYEMQARDAMQPRSNRVLPGKGLNSRYWRIGVANTGGCAFEVHSISAEVAESTRRI